METADLLEREPQLAELLGRRGGTPSGLTPVEQETISESLEELLSTILWPPEVAGCAVVRRGADRAARTPATYPTDAEAAAEYAASPSATARRPASWPARCAPVRASARSASAPMTRTTWCSSGHDLVPVLLELLHTTLEPDAGDPRNDEDDE